MRKVMLALALVALVALAVGCTATQQGAGIGAALGAGTGAIIGHNTHHGGGTGTGALIGAAAGGLGGALAGDAYGNYREKERRQDEAIRGSYYNAPPRQQPPAPSYYPDDYR